MTTLGPYEVHPGADAFPLIQGVEFDQLVHDIAERGLQEPIVLTADGKTLVDGRNRFRACEAAIADPVFRKLPAYYTEDKILDFIVSSNLRRRHLNPGQVAMVAVDLEPLYAKATRPGAPNGNQNAAKSKTTPPDLEGLFQAEPLKGESIAKAAAVTGAARSTAAQAKAVQRDAPDLATRVRQGEIKLDAADKERKKRIAAMPKPEPTPKPSPVLLQLKSHDGAVVGYPKPQTKPTFNETTGNGISWAAWSWNPVTGCLHGCDYCYAREIATSERYKAAYPAGFTPLFHHERLDAPANTVIPAAHRDDPAYKRVFVCSMADLYGRWVPQDWIEQVHASMLRSPDWQYITLTKFPDRYPGLEMPPGAWVGTSVDEQKRVRIAERAFREIPDGVTKWLSLEPLKEPLEFADISTFDWIVIGAQTETRQDGKVVKAFAPPLRWVSRILAQADEAGVPVHCKPNLMGATGPNSPGMVLPNEYPS